MAATTGLEFISKERKEVIQALAIKSKKNPRFEHPSNDEAALLDRLDGLLTRLGDVQMTPEIKEKTQIHKGMEVICDSKFSFPDEYVVRAKSLLEKWESENWGAPVAVKRESGSDPESDGEVNGDGNHQMAKKRKVSASTGKEGSKLLLPKPEHPIWGLNGIMHGICYSKSNGRKSPQLDPRYKDKQRRADVVGKNRLAVGAWFPSQLAALFRGAHGSAQGGIYGNANSGAYSIIISGQYDDLDSDQGYHLYYSGSGSHNNEDPRNPPESTAGTRALKT